MIVLISHACILQCQENQNKGSFMSIRVTKASFRRLIKVALHTRPKVHTQETPMVALSGRDKGHDADLQSARGDVFDEENVINVCSSQRVKLSGLFFRRKPGHKDVQSRQLHRKVSLKRTRQLKKQWFCKMKIDGLRRLVHFKTLTFGDCNKATRI